MLKNQAAKAANNSASPAERPIHHFSVVAYFFHSLPIIGNHTT
jgi:hypothetical protein